MLTMTSGDRYECVYDFGNGRAVVNLEGIYAIATKVTQTEWEFNGEPARENEKTVFNSLVKQLEAKGTTVTVTAPDGVETTFNDGDS